MSVVVDLMHELHIAVDFLGSILFLFLCPLFFLTRCIIAERKVKSPCDSVRHYVCIKLRKT